ncbi:MAG TPA: DEAD/DEAH box helicase [Opitutaceae bacterium]|nr:DEAD/DEAH box helicase [Opitutaceae bacterium]
MPLVLLQAMTNSPNSSSENRSLNFDKLDSRIQRWIWASGWTELRDAQERAIPLILAGDKDVIIAASTASGKTEAAFFPILTSLVVENNTRGLAMYVSPLKALINDQWQRLETLAEALEIPVTPWHGDITGSRKSNFLKNPFGCLLITPESIEAMLMRNGSGVAGILAGLRYIVVDELHSFMGSERGRQLQSQLRRIELLLQRRLCRVGLSATLGDMNGAKQFLRPEDANAVELVVAKDGNQELQVLVKGVLVPNKRLEAPAEQEQEDESDLAAKTAIVTHLFQVLRGSNNLIFPNSRSLVEFYADRLRRCCENAGVPNEFWPHHGNLSKEIREQTEAALKQRERPASAVCTNTLELGIDIGAVKSVAQIGPPPSVASLRQRLGRSGRRKNEPAILRGYAIESELSPKSSLSDLLREGLIQSVAMVRLLTKGWYEPIPTDGLHASTLVQQMLSVIVQYGGLQARQLWDILCEKGAFSAISGELFASLLRRLGQLEIIFQDKTGLILLAPKGERICEHYSFYAAFSSEEEFRIVTAGRTLGSMPITRPLVPNGFIIFAGRRWQVISVSQEDLVIDVRPGAGGTLPSFEASSGAMIHDRVREEMRDVLRNNEPIVFLDQVALKFLEEARDYYKRLGCNESWIRQAGNQTQLLLWKGDRIQDTLLLMLQAKGFKGINEGLCISLTNTTVGDVITAMEEIMRGPPIDALDLASAVQMKMRHKWDALLPDDLLTASFASENLDVRGALAVIGSIVEVTGHG